MAGSYFSIFNTGLKLELEPGFLKVEIVNSAAWMREEDNLRALPTLTRGVPGPIGSSLESGET